MKDNSMSASKLRGVFLDGCILYERIIDDFICHYFGANDFKRNQMKEFIFSTERINFDFKRQIFMGLIPLIFPDFKKEHPKFDKTLQELISTRNVLAHSELLRDVKERGNEEDICYIKYRGGNRLIERFSIETLNILNEKMSYVGDTLASYLEKLYKL